MPSTRPTWREEGGGRHVWPHTQWDTAAAGRSQVGAWQKAGKMDGEGEECQMVAGGGGGVAWQAMCLLSPAGKATHTHAQKRPWWERQSNGAQENAWPPCPSLPPILLLLQVSPGSRKKKVSLIGRVRKVQ